ncbi:hypothetical protein C2845_PM10G15240 [Panicum miliaceum]|uniref:Uncharacterized protein n=1 Tax=Panicum miliaceum TaxID=4540 RepID=A0A3L6PI01_PANMI|nr:hypothetical protein C2845_PM10G15240 [Panicum miliaceum]
MADDEAVSSCSKIYVEAYTSLLSLGFDMAAVRLPSLVCPQSVRENEMVKEHVDQVPLEPADTDVAFLVVEQRVWTKAAGILHFRQKRAPGLQRQAIGRGREQCQKAKDKESLELGAATAVVALAVLLGWLCLPQEAKHPGNVRFTVSLLLSFATFLSGNALMLLSLNLLGRLREDLVSGSQSAASKCTLLLVACAVLSVLTLLSVMVALLPGRVYRYIGLAVVVAVLPPAAGRRGALVPEAPCWRWRRGSGVRGGQGGAGRRVQDHLLRHQLCVWRPHRRPLQRVQGVQRGQQGRLRRVRHLHLWHVVMTVSKKVPEITNLRFRRFLVAAIKLASCVLLCLLASAAFAAAFVVLGYRIVAAFAPLGITTVLCLLLQYCVASHGRRGSRDNNPREQENQEARVKAMEDHASKVTTATMGAIMSVFGGALGEKGGHDRAVAMDAFMVVLTSAFVSGFGFLLLAAAPVPARACLAPAARVLIWSSIALFAATAVAAYGAEIWRS